MALAAHEVLKMGGSISLAHEGMITANITVALGGICSLGNIPNLAHQMKILH